MEVVAAFWTYINLRQDLGAESARSDDRSTEILSAACVCVPTEGVKKPSGTYLSRGACLLLSVWIHVPLQLCLFLIELFLKELKSLHKAVLGSWCVSAFLKETKEMWNYCYWTWNPGTAGTPYNILHWMSCCSSEIMTDLSSSRWKKKKETVYSFS